MNLNKNITLKILSPVHIGAGGEKNWQRGADFVHTNGNVYVLDQRKTWLSLPEVLQNRYLSLLGAGNFNDVEKLLTEELDLDDVANYIFEYDGKLKNKEIKTVIRDGNNEAYIPGSSIKGAIASALFHFIYEKEKPEYVDERKVKEMLGDFSNALGRYIRPSDTALMETDIYDVDLYNLYNYGNNWKGKFKENFTIVLEGFKHVTEGSFRLSIAAGLSDFIKVHQVKTGKQILPKYYNDTLGKNPFDSLFKLINDSTRTHLEREKAYFEKYDDQDEISEILDHIGELEAELEEPNSCVLRLAYGSGFHGITGDWRFQDHTTTITEPDKRNMIYNRTTREKDPARYKSRRLVFPFGGLMGFVKMSF
jgi:CRISPR type III-A-associated RAMP protein Csm5